MTRSLPVAALEERASDQRRQLHDTVAELKSSLRARLDIQRNARKHLLPATGAAAVFGLALGYAVAGLFTGR